MKIIAIGDVHGRNYWKQVAGREDYDVLVFIGDYFDSPHIHFEEQLENFNEIIAFKQLQKDRVKLLVGNHDFHYLPAAIEARERYSGFQYANAPKISRILSENVSLLDMCFHWNGFLFAHAGLTQSWLETAGHRQEPVDQFVNALFRSKPMQFAFKGIDPSGNDITQSPIWVRPSSLILDAYQQATLNQVVGHTKMGKVTVWGNRFYFIDTMSSSKEYLTLTDGQSLIEKLR